MVVLSDTNILAALDTGILKIEPFNPNNLTPNGYDLTISEIAIPNTTVINEGTVSIPPNTRFAVSALERIVCAPDITAQPWLRTSWARKGIMATFGKVDAGFDGTLTLASFNTDSDEVSISIGETYAQIVFETLSEKAEQAYSERSGNYQNQSGVTWSIINMIINKARNKPELQRVLSDCLVPPEAQKKITSMKFLARQLLWPF